MRPRNNVRAYCSAVMTPSLVPTGVSALRNRKIAGGRFGSLAAAELHCRRRQLLPRDRPPWRVTMASAPGHKPPSALQKKAEEATVDHPIVPRKFTGCYGTRVVHCRAVKQDYLTESCPKTVTYRSLRFLPRQPDALGRRDFNLKNNLLRITVAGRKSVTRSLIIVASAAIVLTLAPTAFAQQPGQFGTAAEAKAMLGKAAAAVKSGKAKALDMIARGDLKDRDLYPFCFKSQ
jgi:hypothetical protein